MANERNDKGLFDDEDDDIFKSTMERPAFKERTDSTNARAGDDLFDDANEDIDLNDDHHELPTETQLKLQTNGVETPPRNASPGLTPIGLSPPPLLSSPDASGRGEENINLAGAQHSPPIATIPVTTHERSPTMTTPPLLHNQASPTEFITSTAPKTPSTASAQSPISADLGSPGDVVTVVAPTSPPISPFAQTSPVPRSKGMSPEEEEEPVDIEPKIEISISQYEKRGDGMNAFVVFKVVTKIPGAVPGFPKKEYITWRRFSDFLGLHEKLSTKHLQNGRIVPPAPEKSVLGMTKTKMAKGVEEDSSAAEFLERRRATLERYLRRTSQNPVLLQDPDFREFITLDGDLPKATNTAALSGANVMRLLNKVGDTFTKMTIKMDDSDTWFHDREFEIAELDEQLKKLHNALESLVIHRKELSSSTEAFCKALSLLAACEENTSLSRALSSLVEAEEKIGSAQQDQAEKDFFVFTEVIKDYISMIGAVKEVFHERVKIWQTWQTAQQTLVKKREIKTRFELAAKSDKIPAAKKEVQEWEMKVQEGEEHFAKISKLIKKEMRRFDAQRIRDFKQTLLSYLEALAHTQQQLVKYWEAFLPEAKAINA